MKRLLLLTTFIVGFGGMIGFSYLNFYLPSRVFLVTAPTTIEIPKGSGPLKVSKILQSVDKDSPLEAIKWWLRIGGKFQSIQAGTYRFEGEQSLSKLFNDLKTGNTYDPLVLKVTIPEGSTAKDTFAKLAKEGVGKLSDFYRLFSSAAFLKKAGVESSTLEGYLYPATYSFYGKLPTPEQALLKMIDEFDKRIDENLLSAFKAKDLSLNQAVTFASLIEKETLTDEERPKIAEVIWRRLKKGEPLGIDAALIYGIKDYQGDITWKHLKDPENKYNTRIYKGLPPTPIGSPTVASLSAVLSPTNQGYYYFVRLPGKDKKHHFSKSYREHTNYVNKWIKASQGL